jgi:pimeloyl-ACP methyl ester carboxylesterase
LLRALDDDVDAAKYIATVNGRGYTFAHQADIVDKLVTQLGAKRYTMYVMDYGAPIGYRLALKHPERVSGLIVQNGNAFLSASTSRPMETCGRTRIWW